MESIINSLLSSLGIFALSFYVFEKYFLPKIVDGIIQQELTRRKYEFEKLEYNFKLYTQKQHEVFLKFHQLYGEAKARNLYLVGLQSWPDFSTYSRQDIVEWMDRQELKVLDATRTKILSYYDTGNESLAVDELNKLMTIINYNLAENSISIAHNFALENQLYIPDEVFNLSQEFYNELFSFKIKYADMKNQKNEKIEDYLKGLKDSREKIEDIYVEITKKLKEHMQKGSLNE